MTPPNGRSSGRQHPSRRAKPSSLLADTEVVETKLIEVRKSARKSEPTKPAADHPWRVQHHQWAELARRSRAAQMQPPELTDRVQRLKPLTEGDISNSVRTETFPMALDKSRFSPRGFAFCCYCVYKCNPNRTSEEQVFLAHPSSGLWRSQSLRG